MKRLLATTVLALVAACAKPPPSSMPARPHALTGKLHASAGGSSTKGRLALAWLTQPEAAKWRDGNVDGDMFRTLIERFRPVPSST